MIHALRPVDLLVGLCAAALGIGNIEAVAAHECRFVRRNGMYRREAEQ